MFSTVNSSFPWYCSDISYTGCTTYLSPLMHYSSNSTYICLYSTTGVSNAALSSSLQAPSCLFDHVDLWFHRDGPGIELQVFDSSLKILQNEARHSRIIAFTCSCTCHIIIPSWDCFLELFFCLLISYTCI